MQVAIIGVGNMGEAIYRALYSHCHLSLFDKDYSKIKNYENIVSLEEKKVFDYIILAVKPKDLFSLQNCNWKGRVISLLAGTSLEKIKAVFPSCPIIRLMPNTPLLVGEGISGVYFENIINNQEKEQILEFLHLFTKTVVVEKEELMDAITAISGSGPAYAYLFIEALADAGVRCGLSRNDALLLASQTLLGASQMVLKTQKHPAELKDQVTSPAGTTIEAIAALESNGFRNAIFQAVFAAFEKAKKMG